MRCTMFSVLCLSEQRCPHSGGHVMYACVCHQVLTMRGQNSQHYPNNLCFSGVFYLHAFMCIILQRFRKIAVLPEEGFQSPDPHPLVCLAGPGSAGHRYVILGISVDSVDTNIYLHLTLMRPVDNWGDRFF